MKTEEMVNRHEQLPEVCQAAMSTIAADDGEIYFSLKERFKEFAIDEDCETIELNRDEFALLVAFMCLGSEYFMNVGTYIVTGER